MLAATKTLALVVEDDASTRDLICRACWRNGIATMQAATMGEALLRLEQGPTPTAIILDLSLPDGPGTILLRRIARDQLSVKVAVVTGNDPAKFPELNRHPPNRLFQKPLDFQQLIDWLNEDQP